MSNLPIGVFDSGIGGLTAVKQLHKLLPCEDIIYLGDCGRNPYGTRSKETILKYSKQAIHFLQGKGVKAIVAACGTASTVLLDDKVLSQIGCNVPFSNIVLPSARSATTLSANGHIGVIATSAAIRSGAYGKAIRSISSSAKVFGNACPLLVPIVENGLVQMDNEIARLAIKMYLEPLIREEIDTLILGCTHYPLLYDIINDVLEYKVTLIDPSIPTIESVKRSLMEQALLTPSDTIGNTTYYITDQFAIESFETTAKMFMQSDMVNGKVLYVPIEEIDVI